MADNNIDLTATFDTSGAIKGVNDFGKSATKSLEGVNDAFGNLQKSVTKTSNTKLRIDSSSAISALDGLKGKIQAVGAGIAAYFSAQAIGSFFRTMINESVDAETNLNQLNAALARTGQLTPAVSASMEKFSTDLMAVSTIDDDVINGQLAIALNFTKTADKAQDLVGAAANLSAAMKIDLGTAVELLGRTLDGTAGRLNETVPALRGVSVEALKSGAAIQIVNKQFAGAALSEINTYAGAMKQLDNVFGNFAAALGDMIVQNPMVSQAIKEISKAFLGATENIKDGSSAMVNFVNRGMVSLISGIRDLLPSLNVFSSFLKSLGFLFELLIKGIGSFVDTLKILGNAWIWLVGTLEGKKSALGGIEDAISRVNKRADELTASLMDVGTDSFTKLDLKSLDDALKRIQEAADKKPIDISTKYKNEKPSDIYKDIELKAEKEPKVTIERQEDFALDPVVEAEKKRLQAFESKFANYSDWLDNLQVDFAGGFMPAIKAASYIITRGLFEVSSYMLKNLPSIFSNISGIVSAMGQGAEGAKKAIPDLLAKMTTGIGEAVGSIWGPVGSAIGSGIGGIIGEQIKLASGPIGETLTKIDEFMAEVPKVLDRITENLPTIMNKVFENFPKLFLAIFKALPAIMRASASAMKPLFEAIGKESNSIAQVALEVVWESIAMIMMAVGYAFQGLILGLQKAWKEKLNAAWKKVTDIFADIFDGTTKEKIRNIFTIGIGKVFDITFSGTIKGIIKNGFGGLFDGTFEQNIKDIFKNGFGGLFDGTFEQNIKDIFKNGFSGLFDGTFLENIRQIFRNGFGGLFDGTFEKNIRDAFINGFGGLFDGTFEKNIKDIFIGGFGGLFDGTFEKNVKDVFINGFGGLFDGTFEKNIKDVFIGAFGGLFTNKFWQDVGQAIIDGFKGIFKNLNPAEIVQGGGKGGKTGGEVAVNILTGGLAATGGVVPKGYPDDSYPALLTSNEVVVPVSTVPNLFSLIDKLASGTATTSNNQGSEETNSLLRQLITIMSNQQTQIDVKLDRDTLARAIISLNKDNRRLA